MHQKKAKLSEIAILASEDTHYSIAKGSNILQIDWIVIPVSFEKREINQVALEEKIIEAKKIGINYFIVVMFRNLTDPIELNHL